MPQVKILTLCDVGITDAGISNIARLFPNLTTLILSHCKQLTESGFITANVSTKWTTLSLAKSSITSTGLNALCRKLPQLRSLDLSECRLIQPIDFRTCNWPKKLCNLNAKKNLIDQCGLLHFFNTNTAAKSYNTLECPNLESHWQTVVDIATEEEVIDSRRLEEELFKLEL